MPQPTAEKALRVEAFASFFKRYMGVSAVVSSALPIPVASFGLIPTFASQTRYLSVYTTLFCFLTLAFVFYNRHALARWMFVERYDASGTAALGSGRFLRARLRLLRNAKGFVASLLPLLCIAISANAAYQYQELVDMDVRLVLGGELTAHASRFDKDDPGAAYIRLTDERFDEALRTERPFPYQEMLLAVTYIVMFVFAEAAFVLMALKEYLLDLLGLDDAALIEDRFGLAAVHPPETGGSSALP